MAKEKYEDKKEEVKEESYIEKKFKGMELLKPVPKPAEGKVSRTA